MPDCYGHEYCEQDSGLEPALKSGELNTYFRSRDTNRFSENQRPHHRCSFVRLNVPGRLRPEMPYQPTFPDVPVYPDIGVQAAEVWRPAD